MGRISLCCILLACSVALAQDKSLGGAFDGLEKTLKKNLHGAEFQLPAPVRVARYERPNQIQTGVKYEDVLRRLGPPSLEITTGPLSKTLSYWSREGAFQVDIREGKVSSVVSVLR